MADNTPHDLTSGFDRDQKRSRDHKHKWAAGEAEETRGIRKRRPAKHPGANHDYVDCKSRDRDAYCYYCHPHYTFTPKTTKTRKISDECLDRWDSPIDSIYDFEAAIRASTLEAAYTYSYDSKSGASNGSQVLGTALAKAVDKHETEAINRLIKSEYEVVGDEKEDAETGHGLTDDGFELI